VIKPDLDFAREDPVQAIAIISKVLSEIGMPSKKDFAGLKLGDEPVFLDHFKMAATEKGQTCGGDFVEGVGKGDPSRVDAIDDA